MRYFFVVLIGAALAFMALHAASMAQPAPPSPATGGKTLTLTPQEEQALVGPNQILDTAQQGRPLDLTGAVQYFRNKIREAPPAPTAPPAGEPPK